MKTSRDDYGIPAVLGNSKSAKAIPIKSTDSGSLFTTDNKVLIEVVKLDMQTERNKMIILDNKNYNEITVNIVDNEFIINFLDSDNSIYDMTITRPVSINLSGNKIWITNTQQQGNIEIWIWR